MVKPKSWKDTAKKSCEIIGEGCNFKECLGINCNLFKFWIPREVVDLEIKKLIKRVKSEDEAWETLWHYQCPYFKVKVRCIMFDSDYCNNVCILHRDRIPILPKDIAPYLAQHLEEIEKRKIRFKTESKRENPL